MSENFKKHERNEKDMGIANKYNKTKMFNFKCPEHYKYRALGELFEHEGQGVVYPVKALYINKKSKFGEAPIVATDSCLVNLPSHLLDTVKEMMRDDEVIDAVNENKLGFTIYSYEDTVRNQICYSINWIDM